MIFKRHSGAAGCLVGDRTRRTNRVRSMALADRGKLLGLEPLEQRVLLTVSSWFSAGVLTFSGDSTATLSTFVPRPACTATRSNLIRGAARPLRPT